MKKIDKLKRAIKHSKEFINLLTESKDTKKAINVITHSNPLLIFWISPQGDFINVETSHFNEPPLNDKSILSSKTFKGYLRGRAAYIGNKIYIVIYCYGTNNLSNYQLALLRISYSKILDKLKKKNTKINLNNINFITELGEDIEL